MLFSITVAALAALGNLYATPQVSILGFVSTLANSAALLFAERAFKSEGFDEKRSDSDDDMGPEVEETNEEYQECVKLYQHVAAVVALGCAISMLLLEGFSSTDWIINSTDDEGSHTWTLSPDFRDTIIGTVLGVFQSFCMLRLVSRALSALTTSTTRSDQCRLPSLVLLGSPSAG